MLEPDLSVVELVFPGQANHLGTLHGGDALRMMTRTGAILASKWARGSVVLASTSAMHFTAPLPEGHLADIAARVARTGTSSISVAIQMVAEDLRTGARTASANGVFEFVAVDGNGRPRPVSVPWPSHLAPTPGSTRMASFVFPGQTNHHGTLFAGEALRLVDIAAVVAGSRHCRRPVVTVAMDRVSFPVAVAVGEIVEAVATIVSTGRTSMSADVELGAMRPGDDGPRACVRASVALVALGDDGRPTPVPALVLGAG